MNKTTGAWLTRFSWPKVFCLGVLCGLLVCSVLGRHIARTGYYRNFLRFGGGHQLDPTFFPTASQMKAVIESQCKKEQVLVLVGGSSVMFGAGQPVRYLWTKRLNQELGPGYCVVNLAVPAGGFAGYASVALEIVGNEYKRKLLLTDTDFPLDPADGMLWYKHMFWDAYYKDMLNHSIVTRTRERLAHVLKGYNGRKDKERNQIEQTRLGMLLDGYLYFNDLWTYVHYNYMQTRYYLSYAPRRHWA